MSGRVGDGERAGLGDAEKGDFTLRSRFVDHGLEIGELGLEREVVSGALGEPRAAPIVDEQPERSHEPSVEILHAEVVPLKLQVADPTGRHDEQRPLAPRHVGEPLPVSVATEGDPRLHEKDLILMMGIAPARLSSRRLLTSSWKAALRTSVRGRVESVPCSGRWVPCSGTMGPLLPARWILIKVDMVP